MSIKIAIIGGSGLYKMEGLTDVEEISISTPFGSPSDTIMLGSLAGTRVAFLARHGRQHRFIPTDVPYRANIWALKSIGVEYIISVSACGSLQEHVKPLDMVLVDQFIDKTVARPSTFFGNGIAAHVAFGDPVCPSLRSIVLSAARHAVAGLSPAATGTEDSGEKVVVHDGGVYVCMEGPAFSTKAESNFNRMIGGTVIGMTGVTEAKLARESEIAYCCIACATDYDCWHPSHDQVTVDLVVSNLRKNLRTATAILTESVKRIATDMPHSEAHSALRFGIQTPPEFITQEVKERLRPLLSKYFPDEQ